MNKKELKITIAIVFFGLELAWVFCKPGKPMGIPAKR
jgi:hypothetical protein